jgi:hypothetical protein
VCCIKFALLLQLKIVAMENDKNYNVVTEEDSLSRLEYQVKQLIETLEQEGLI